MPLDKQKREQLDSDFVSKLDKAQSRIIQERIRPEILTALGDIKTVWSILITEHLKVFTAIKDCSYFLTEKKPQISFNTQNNNNFRLVFDEDCDFGIEFSEYPKTYIRKVTVDIEEHAVHIDLIDTDINKLLVEVDIKRNKIKVDHFDAFITIHEPYIQHTMQLWAHTAWDLLSSWDLFMENINKSLDIYI